MKTYSLDESQERTRASVILDRSGRLDDRGMPPIHTISLIAGSAFDNEVLSALLRHRFPDVEIKCHHSAADWERESPSEKSGEIVLYNLGEQHMSEPSVKAALKDFVSRAGARMVVVISRNDDALDVFDAIDCGAAGFIPASAGVEELVDVMRVPSYNSVTIPLSTITALRGHLASRPENQPGLEQHFTERQLDVARALRRGAANKTIAFKLGLCESTVKVHVRNIMRKLQATNRTQAAFRLNELANGNPEIEVLPDA